MPNAQTILFKVKPVKKTPAPLNLTSYITWGVCKGQSCKQAIINNPNYMQWWVKQYKGVVQSEVHQFIKQQIFLAQ